MQHSQQLEQLRSIVQAELERLEESHTECLQETILIRDGHYCGRRFRSDQFQAVWYADENQVKYFGPEGQVLNVHENVLPGTPARILKKPNEAQEIPLRRAA